MTTAFTDHGFFCATAPGAPRCGSLEVAPTVPSAVERRSPRRLRVLQVFVAINLAIVLGIVGALLRSHALRRIAESSNALVTTVAEPESLTGPPDVVSATAHEPAARPARVHRRSRHRHHEAHGHRAASHRRHRATHRHTSS